MNPKQARIFRIGLIGAYAAIPIVLTVGTYRGWLFQSGASNANTNAAVVGLIALLLATMLAESAGVFKRAAAGRDVLIAVAYWLGAVVWVVAVVRLVPDNRTGVAVLIGPLSALMLGGVFHLSRFAGMFTRALTGTLMTAEPTSVAPTIPSDSSSDQVPHRSDELSQTDRIDIAANTAKIALRFLGGAAGLLVLAQVVRGTNYDVFGTYLFYLGAIFLGLMALRSLPRRAPALSLGSDGILIRRDLCAIPYLPWTEIIGLEMKSAVANTFLVIRVRNPDALIAQRGPVSRWFMNQSLAMFGSPVRIPVAWLKCDPNWLWQKMNEMRASQQHRAVSPPA